MKFICLMGKKAWHQPQVASQCRLVLNRAVPIPFQFQQALRSPELAGSSAICILIKITIPKTYAYSNLYIIQEGREMFPHLTPDFENKVIHSK